MHTETQSFLGALQSQLQQQVANILQKLKAGRVFYRAVLVRATPPGSVTERFRSSLLEGRGMERADMVRLRGG